MLVIKTGRRRILMNEPSCKELRIKYMEALELINDLSETLEKRQWDIILLKESISELEDILYANGIFRHFDFD